jgi:acetate kinase
MSGDLLVLNSGSSSLKFAVYALSDGEVETEPRRRLRGQITGLDARPRFQVKDGGGGTVEERDPSNGSDSFGQDEALGFLLDWLDRELEGQPLRAAGHRVVHGGQAFQGAVRVTDEVLDRLDTLVPLAPLHQPHNIAPIRSLAKSRPDLFQVACFRIT